MLKYIALASMLSTLGSTPIEHNGYILAACPWANCSDRAKRPPIDSDRWNQRRCCVPKKGGGQRCFPCLHGGVSSDTLTDADREE